MIYPRNRKLVSTLLSLFFLLAVTKVFAQEEKEVVSLFETQVDRFEAFFASKPKLLEKTSYSDSPTGYVFVYSWFNNYKLSYDIRKTDSLISPYTGYISLDYLETTSTKCGDLKGYKSKYSKEEADRFFTTIDAARQKKDDDSCYKPFGVGGKEIRRSAKFIFAFQKKTWSFKDVVYGNDNTAHKMFWAALGKPVSDWFYVEDNDFWKKLIE